MTNSETIARPADLNKLEFHLVVAVAEMRGEAIVRFTQTVTELRELALAGRLRSGHLEMLYDWVQEFMMHVMDAERFIAEGRSAEKLN